MTEEARISRTNKPRANQADAPDRSRACPVASAYAHAWMSGGSTPRLVRIAEICSRWALPYVVEFLDTTLAEQPQPGLTRHRGH